MFSLSFGFVTCYKAFLFSYFHFFPFEQDVGGGDKIRILFRHYLGTDDKTCQSLIWVVNSTDKERIEESRTELLILSKRFLEKSHPKFLPILIFVTKRDLPSGMTGKEVEAFFHLEDEFPDNNVEWHFQESSVITGQGLDEGLDFLRKCYLSHGL